MKFHENTSNSRRVVQYGGTNEQKSGQTGVAELIVGLRSFAIAPKIRNTNENLLGRH